VIKLFQLKVRSMLLQVFGWGNSEYGQLSMVTSETQVGVPTLLPVTKTTGRVTQISAGGSSCMVLNGEHWLKLDNESLKSGMVITLEMKI